MKKIYLQFILSLFGYAAIFAQPNSINETASQNKIGLLKKQLATAKADGSQMFLLNELAQEYVKYQPDSSLSTLKQALEIAQRNQDLKSMAQTMNRLGYTYLYSFNNDAKALEWLNKSNEIAKKTENNFILAQNYQYISLVAFHQKIGNPIELVKTAIDYAQKTDDWRILVDCYEVSEVFYSDAKDFGKLEETFAKLLQITQKHDLDKWFTNGLDYCDLLKKQGKLTQADSFYQLLDANKSKLKRTQGDFVYFNDVGTLEMKIKNYVAAEKNFLKALQTETEKSKADTIHLVYVFRNLQELYTTTGDYKKGLEYNQKLSDARLSLQKKRQTTDSKLQMTQMKAAFDLEKKETQIALMTAQSKLQQRFMLFLLVIAALLISFVVFIRRSQLRIQEQKEELIALNATKDKVFAILSHDLMSPVATLKNYTMLMDWGVMSQAEFAESAKSLETNVNNVYNLLENVLHWSISQMQGMKPKLETVDIAAVISEQIALLEPIAKTKNIELGTNIQSPTILEIDKNHLALIVRNLLQNALKFTPTGGKIAFNFKNTEGVKQLEIQDNGIGMSVETLTHLFKIEKNAHRIGTAKEGGTGLGLILTKELVELNHGTIGVSSETGKGTKFSLAF